MYRPGDSTIHRLDPRLKIAGLIILTVAAFTFEATLSLAVILGLLLAGFLAAGIPLGEVFSGLKGFIWLFAFTALLQLFWTPGTPVFHIDLGFIQIAVTGEGARRGWIIFLRLTAVITGANLMSATTSPGRLGSGIERLLSPLSRLGVPVEDVALAFSIGMQFLPIIFNEAEEIRNAQASRGIGHLARNPLTRIHALHAILIPVLVRTVKRTEDLSTAMILRGYREGARRTSLYPLGLEKRDYLAALLLTLSLLIAGAAGHINVFH
jgi:energy-coupling factor transport system permease protein